MTDSILIIDDDPSFNRILSRSLERRGFATTSALSADDGLRAASSLPARVVLDLNLDGQSGLSLIPRFLAISPASQIVVLTGYASISTAVEAIKRGAIQYLAKPVDIETLLLAFGETNAVAIEPAIEEQRLSVDRLEWEHIQRVLSEHEGNISATARALHMHRRTLQRKLAKRPVKQ